MLKSPMTTNHPLPPILFHNDYDEMMFCENYNTRSLYTYTLLQKPNNNFEENRKEKNISSLT